MYKHYLYRHIRLDKNEPFYIGIGTKLKNYNGTYSEYKRGYDCVSRRNKIWKDIVNKTEHMVEILIESNNYNFIKEKEKEFIKLYGRKNLGTGTLANMTDGGDGSLNIIYTKERAAKISKANKGRIKSKEERIKISKNLQKVVINKITGRRFPSIIEAANYEKLKLGAFYQSLWNCSPNCKYEYEDNSLNYPKNVKTGKGVGTSGIKVKNTETGDIFNTCKEAALYEGIYLSVFYSRINSKTKYFKFKKLNNDRRNK